MCVPSPLQGHIKAIASLCSLGLGTDQVRTGYGAGNTGTRTVLKKNKFAQCNASRVLPIHLSGEACVLSCGYPSDESLCFVKKSYLCNVFIF